MADTWLVFKGIWAAIRAVLLYHYYVPKMSFYFFFKFENSKMQLMSF